MTEQAIAPRLQPEVRCAHREMVDPAALVPHPRNPNRHSGEQVALLAKIILHQGWRNPITVSNRSGFVVAGHARLAAGLALGCLVVPVDRQDFANEADEYAHMIADNRIAEIAEMNLPALKDLLVELDTGGLDMDLTGFDARALEDLIVPVVPQDDDQAGANAASKAAELQEKWKVKRGQLWDMGGSMLLCGDSTDPRDVALLMGNEKAVLMNTDPPYGVNYGDIRDSVRAGTGGRDPGHGRITNDDLSGEELQAFLEKSIRCALPHLIENPAFYLWHPMLTQGTFFAAAAAAAADILIHRQIIWVKPSLIMGRGDYHWRHELCFYGWIKGKRCAWLAGRDQDTVWEVARDNDGLHPTQKPLELFVRPMSNHSKPGDVVYEPFAGSGSQFVAAHRMKRRCYGLEIEPRFCAVVLERMHLLGVEPHLVGAGADERQHEVAQAAG